MILILLLYCFYSDRVLFNNSLLPRVNCVMPQLRRTTVLCCTFKAYELDPVVLKSTPATIQMLAL